MEYSSDIDVAELEENNSAIPSTKERKEIRKERGNEEEGEGGGKKERKDLDFNFF